MLSSEDFLQNAIYTDIFTLSTSGEFNEDFKNFSVSETKMIANSCIIFLQDENGNDWYESQKDFSDETLKVAFDTQGVIVSMSYDVSALFPVGFSVAEIPASEVPELVDINGGWVFDGKKLFGAFTQNKNSLRRPQLNGIR